MNFDSIIQMIEEAANLPLGTIRVLTGFDLDHIIRQRIAIAEKDKAKILGFMPAVIQRVADLGVTVGFQIGLAQALGEGLSEDNISIGKSAEVDQLVREGTAVLAAYYDQARHLSIGDPFKDEREDARIFAKRNGLNAGYQELLGVSEGTPTEYPDDFVEKYL